MNPKEFAEKMAVIAKYNDRDEESSHVEADDLMCEVLTELGYRDGIEIYRKMTLWYA